ncbi:MAG: type III glutamate--ammonia ligase, partial [Gammaproteobacteria bacterium]
MNLKQAQKFLKDHAVQYVLAQFVDIHGVAKTKAVPVAHFTDILTNGAGFAGFAVWGLGMGPHDADFMAIGDLSTLSLVPWQPGYARIVCDGAVRGKPYAYDTRLVLKKLTAKALAKGWIVNIGIEPEFMLLARRADGTLGPADTSDALDKPCYDYKGLARNRDFLERLVASLQAVGFDIYQIDHEDANGQFEINYTYSEALNAADRYVLFRMAAGEIVREIIASAAQPLAQ